MSSIDWSKPNVMQGNQSRDWSKPNENVGWASIGRDIKSLPKKAGAGVKQLFNTLGEEAPYFGESHQQDPTRAPRTGYASLVKGLNAGLNLPGTLRDYLGEKQVIPEETPSFRFNEKLVPRQINEGELYKTLGLGEKKRGDIFGELVPDILTAVPGAAKGVSKAAQVAPKIASKGAELGIKGAQLGIEGLKKGAPVVGAGLKYAGDKTTSSIKKGYQKATERTKAIESLEAQERALKKEIHTLNKQVPESQIERSGDIQKIIDAEQARRNPHAENIAPYLTNEKEKKVGALTKSLTQAKKEIVEPLQKDWKAFEDSQPMQKRILEPLDYKDFERILGDPKSFSSEALEELISKTIGRKEHIDEHTDIIHGAVPGKDIYHKAEPLIKDYIKLYRQSRDEAANWKYEAKHADRTPDVKEQAGIKAKKLRQLAAIARKKIEGYLDENELKEFKKLEYRHEHEDIPWRESGLLKNATERHPKIKGENFSQALTNENYVHLRNKLLENHPDVKESMAAYDLRNFPIENPKKIQKLLQSDQGRALPDELQTALHEIGRSIEAEQELIDLRSKLTRGEVINQIHSKQLKEILNKHPELADPFTSDLDRRTRLRKLRNELKDKGLDKEEIENSMSKFEKIVGWAKKGSTAIAGAKAVAAAKLVGILM